MVMMYVSDPYNPRDIEAELIEKAPIPIHVISLHDISELLRFVNTP